MVPGAVLTQGTVPVSEGRFEYHFNPAAIHSAIPIYDIVNLVNGKPEIGRVVHLTFFSQEKAPDGTTFHNFIRVILRGTQAIVTR